ncbi:MAG: hypothetical protein V4635_05980 [Bacteroidota bacterium]
MNRLALIIKGHSRTEEETETDLSYVRTYYQFLNSIAGGAWDESEITFLDEPEIEDYAEIIRAVKPTYGLTILIGHGATLDDHQLFQLNENIVVKPGQFVFDTDKQLIILESCRSNIEDIYWVDLENKLPMYRYGGYVRGHITRQTSKDIFEYVLNQCDPGIVICFACSKNQAAYNYFFSTELVQCAQNLFLDTLYHYCAFGILDMMPYVTKRVNRKARKAYGVEQVPETSGDINFPFAISKFDLLDWEKKKLQGQ